MSASSLSRITVIVLVLVGILAGTWRAQARRERAQAIANSRWQVTYDVQFLAGGATVSPEEAPEVDPEDIPDEYRMRMALPQDSSRANVVGEEIIHTGLPARYLTGGRSGTRYLELISPQFGVYRIGAQFEIETSSRPPGGIVRRPTPLPEGARAAFLRSSESFPYTDPAVQRLLLEAPKSASDNALLEWMFSYCTRLGNPPPDVTRNDVSAIVGFKQASPLGRVRTFVTLCRGVRRATGTGFPARIVCGLELRHDQNAQPLVWAEVYHDSRWIPFDPVGGWARRLPDNYLPIRFDGDRLVWVPRDSDSRVEADFSVTRMDPVAELLAADQPHWSEMFDLTRLPFEMHRVMALMLLLPLGALITAFFRNIIGIHTFGTFAPALLALSFIYAAFGSGLVILTTVLMVGILGRTVLERLHLLMVPRLSIILTVIILCVVFLVSALEVAGVTPSAQAVLLPLVILTILIERLYVVSEEDGPAYALQLSIGTLVVSAFCYMLLRWDDVGRFILAYPEVHLLTLAAFIGIGRYTGYRLTELWRFRDLLRTEEER
jgi:hypothetical protein